MKPYDLSDTEELIQFDSDCARAASYCPQSTCFRDEVGIRCKTTDGEQIFHDWESCEELWDHGYCEYLSDKAAATLKHVRKHGEKGLKELCSKRDIDTSVSDTELLREVLVALSKSTVFLDATVYSTTKRDNLVLIKKLQTRLNRP